MDEQDEPPTSIVPPKQSQFVLVKFLDIEKHYTPNTDVKVKYSIQENFQPSKRDWIGLFKVGWQTTREYHTYVYLSSNEEVDTVQFKAHYLPKDDDDYQFCYVDYKGEVQGVSTTIQFCRDITEEEDIMIVTKESEVMKDKEENIALKERVVTLNKENSELKDENQILKANQLTATDKIKAMEMVEKLTKENTALQDKIQDQYKINELLTEQIRGMQIDKACMNEDVQCDLQKVISREEVSETTYKQDESLQNQMKCLTEDKQKLDSELSQYRENEEKMLLEKKEMEILLQKCQDEINYLKEAVEIVNGTLKACKEKIIKLQAECEMQERTLENVKIQNEELQHLLEEEKKKTLDLECNMKDRNARLQCAQETISNLHDQLAWQQVQMKTLENKKVKHEKVHESLEEQKATALDAKWTLKKQCKEKTVILMQQLAEQQDENNKQRIVIEELRRSNEQLESDMMKLRQMEMHENNKQRIEIEELRRRREQLESDMMKLRQMEMVQSGELENERKMNENLQDSFKKQNKTAMGTKRDLQEQQKKMLVLEQKLSKQQDEITCLRSTTEVQEAEIEKLKQTEREQTGALENEKKKNVNLQQLLDEQFSQNTTAMDTERILQEELKKTHIQGLKQKDEIDLLKSTIGVLETEIDKLHERIKNVNINASKIFSCPVCGENFLECDFQVFNDHVVCHYESNPA